MTLQLRDVGQMPTDTGALGQQLLPADNPYRVIGEQVPELLADADFAGLYQPIGRAAISPALLALVTLFQFTEDVPDRQAATLVAVRLDWKYALRLPLAYAGFDFTVLHYFRDRLRDHQQERLVFDRLLGRMRALGLLPKAKVRRQRTDSLAVVGAVHQLSHLETVSETLRVVVRELEQTDRGWTRQALPASFRERYGQRQTDYRLSEAERQAALQARGEDGAWLLARLAAADVPPAVQQVAVVETLRTVWTQRYEVAPQPADPDDGAGPGGRSAVREAAGRAPEAGAEGTGRAFATDTEAAEHALATAPRAGRDDAAGDPPTSVGATPAPDPRGLGGPAGVVGDGVADPVAMAVAVPRIQVRRTLPPATERVITPHDPGVRMGRKRGQSWLGAKVHVTETAEPVDPQVGLPNFLTDITTANASSGDGEALSTIRAALTTRGLAPDQQVVDAGYVSGQQLAQSQAAGIELLGPPLADNSPQEYKLADFTIDRQAKQAICPQGQVSVKWSQHQERDGSRAILIRFPATACATCPDRARCTTSQTGGRSLHLNEHHDLVVARRQAAQTPAFREQMRARPAIESTLSELVRGFGLRRHRYRGDTQRVLENLLKGAACNLWRLARALRMRPRTYPGLGLVSQP